MDRISTKDEIYLILLARRGLTQKTAPFQNFANN